MRRLLSANLFRLWRSRLFWTLEITWLVLGFLTYGLVAYNTHTLGNMWLERKAHSYFYFQFLYLPVVIAIFASCFCGTDHSERTLQNRCVVGHSRPSIYISGLLTICLTALLFALTGFAGLLLVGLPFSGSAVITHVQAQPWRLVNCALVIAEYITLFTMLSMLDNRPMRNIVICLLLSAAMLLIGSLVYGRLSEPEFVSGSVLLPDGTLALREGVSNARYLTGNTRVLFTWLTALTPSASFLASIDKSFAFDVRIPACSLAIIAMHIAMGLVLFRRKDIS